MLSEESVQESVTTAGPGKKAAVTSLVAATGMRTITENAVESGTAIARGTGTETVRERGKGNTDIVKRKSKYFHFSSPVSLLPLENSSKEN